MIQVMKADEPDAFEERVRTPGLRAIAEMVGERPPRKAGKRFKKVADRRDEIKSDDFPAYWTESLDELMEAYRRICAYSCFRIHPVTGGRSVDHFAAKSLRWDKVYEWDNYRLACSLLNARKKDFSNLLDPFEIEDSWFQLELVGFQIVPNPSVEPSDSNRIIATIVDLGLNDFKNDRSRDAENYWSRDVSFKTFLEESPFVARELRRQGRLNPGDS